MNYRSKILNRIQIDLKRDSTKPIVYSSLIVVFLFTMTFIFFIPSVDVVNKLREKNNTLNERKNYLENLYKNYKQSSEYLDVIRDKASVFEKNIPSNPDPYYFVRQINSYSIKNNIVLRNVRLITKDKGDEGYDVIINGDYTDIENFFKDLKSDTRYFSTEILKLSPKENLHSTDNVLTLNVKIYVFYK